MKKIKKRSTITSMTNYIVKTQVEAEEIIRKLGLIPRSVKHTNSIRGYMTNQYLVDLVSDPCIIQNQAIAVLWNGETGEFCAFCHIFQWHLNKCTTDMFRKYVAESYNDLVDLVATIKDNIKYTIEKIHNENIADILSVLN